MMSLWVARVPSQVPSALHFEPDSSTVQTVSVDHESLPHRLLPCLPCTYGLAGRRQPAFRGRGHPFVVVPPMLAAFFSQHRGSTLGSGLFAADLKTRRLFELSPNGGSIFPLPRLAIFACVCDQLYLPLGNGKMNVNCSYLDLWDARMRRIRFAEKKPAIFYGASLFVEGTPPQVISIPGKVS